MFVVDGAGVVFIGAVEAGRLLFELCSLSRLLLLPMVAEFPGGVVVTRALLSLLLASAVLDLVVAAVGGAIVVFIVAMAVALVACNDVLVCGRRRCGYIFVR